MLLEDETRGKAYVEVKNTTLAEADLAKFPDAVTSRGLKHLHELARVVEEGHRGVMLYCVSREDVTRFTVADEIDPAYGKALREVAEAGVELLAYSTKVTPSSFELHRRLTIEL